MVKSVVQIGQHESETDCYEARARRVLGKLDKLLRRRVGRRAIVRQAVKAVRGRALGAPKEQAARRGHALAARPALVPRADEGAERVGVVETLAAEALAQTLEVVHLKKERHDAREQSEGANRYKLKKRGSDK
jgi:hypothetical protein